MKRTVAAGVAALGVALVAAVAWWATRSTDAAPARPRAIELPAPHRPPTTTDDALSDDEAHVLARVALTRAEQALRQGDLTKSGEAAREALRLDADMADAMRVLAVVEKRSGRDDEACRLMRAYVGRAATPEPARARLLASACGDAPAQ